MPAMPAKFMRNTRNGKKTYNMANMVITVDPTRVEMALDAIEGAISEPGLMAFMRGFVDHYLTEEMIKRFANHGDGPGGDWEPLSETTVRIKRALGYGAVSDDPNERTGQMLSHLLYDHDIHGILGGAEIVVPDESGDALMHRKLQTAQQGRVQGSSDQFPGAVTPARPVLSLDEEDARRILWDLFVYIGATGSVVGNLT